MNRLINRAFTERTVNKWKSYYPEFFESMRRGKILADANTKLGVKVLLVHKSVTEVTDLIVTRLPLQATPHKAVTAVTVVTVKIRVSTLKT